MSRNPSFKFRVKNTKYEIRVGDLMPVDSQDFRREVGIPLMHSFGLVDLDVIAGFVWLIRRRAQHDLTYADVAKSFTYDDYEFGHGDEPGGDAEDAASPPE